MQKTNNLQDIFLTKARKENVPVTLFLVNGFQLRGSVTGFDSCGASSRGLTASWWCWTARGGSR